MPLSGWRKICGSEETLPAAIVPQTSRHGSPEGQRRRNGPTIFPERDAIESLHAGQSKPTPRKPLGI